MNYLLTEKMYFFEAYRPRNLTIQFLLLTEQNKGNKINQRLIQFVERILWIFSNLLITY